MFINKPEVVWWSTYWSAYLILNTAEDESTVTINEFIRESVQGHLLLTDKMANVTRCDPIIWCFCTYISQKGVVYSMKTLTRLFQWKVANEFHFYSNFFPVNFLVAHWKNMRQSTAQVVLRELILQLRKYKSQTICMHTWKSNRRE